jgi:integrase
MTELTVQCWFDDYIAALAGTVTDHTTDDYRSYVRALPAGLANMQLTELTHDDVAAWITAQRAAGLAASTIRTRHAFLRAALRRAVLDGVIGVNPAHQQKLPAQPPVTVPRALTHTQFAALLNEITEHYRPLVAFLVASGARWNEATALRPADVDRATGTVWITKAWKLTPSTTTYRLGTPKTRKSVRLINVSTEVLDTLDYTGEFLFTTVTSKPVRMPNFHKTVWRPAVDRAALGFRPRVHDLRHTCASWMLAGGSTMYRVRDHLGHQNIQTTINTYAHVDREQASRDADIIGKFVGDILPKP